MAGQRASISAAILSIATVGAGISLLIPLLSLKMQRLGYSDNLIGLNSSIGALATLISAPFIPKLAKFLGIRALLLSAIALSILCIMGFALREDIYLWFVLRLLLGFGLTVLFIISEFWINAAATPNNRGAIMGCYAMALGFGFALGPALLSLMDTHHSTPFAVGAGIFASAGLVITLMADRAPVLNEKPKASGLFRLLPTMLVAMAAAATTGAIEISGFSLLTPFGLEIGLNEAQSTQIVGFYALGGTVLVLPLTTLSDYMDKRLLLLILSLLGAFAALFIGTLRSFPVLAAALLLWGGIISAFYPIALTYLGDRFKGGTKLADANSAIAMAYSLGMLIGPICSGYGLQNGSTTGFSVTLTAICLINACILLVSIVNSKLTRS